MNLPVIIKFVIDLLAVLLLALGIKGLSKVKSARDANRLAAFAMSLSVVGLLSYYLGTSGIAIQSWIWIIIGSIIGSLFGAILAKKVPMTSMPETVALFNGCGGMSSLLVALGVAIFPISGGQENFDFFKSLINEVSISVSIFVGAITFTGSIVAMAKLQGWLSTPGWTQSKVRHFVNIVFAVASLIAFFDLINGNTSSIWLLVIVSSLLGIGVTLPIGGADMPVVISLLNSYSGIAAAAAGFVVDSQLLIVAGAMVGAAGLILTQVMCKGMNRSLVSVLFGGSLSAQSTASSGSGEYTNITSCSVEECALTLEAANKVIIVPGYGLAVAQAQHTLREVTKKLEQNGIEVVYAIHPVAGRMPGHMNVLLAEANVSYDVLVEPQDVNPIMDTIDVCIVIGANDVVNPDAREDESSPIYGMPVIEVDRAKTVFVLKRSMASGFAGIENSLFFKQNTRMLFGDAKESVSGLVSEFKS